MSLSFSDFFSAVHGVAPFPWQKRLAERVCSRGWPQVIALPTGSGKTACLDIAAYAMAFGKPPGPRRVFYVVDRRLIVSEAYSRMRKICGELNQQRALAPLKEALAARADGDGEDGLQAWELRGGTYLDNSWVRSPLQPLLAACTVDQLGSRLLFRGYGVKDAVAPIHAALVANDSLILLDEAHASRAFSHTLEAVERYAARPQGECGLPKPLQFVEMTATPNRQGGERFELDDRDRADARLRCRLQAPKPVRLIEPRLKRNDAGHLAECLAATAIEEAAAAGAGRTAVLCNRVQTARLTRDHLRRLAGAEPILLTGRMRPWDRDKLYDEHLQALKSGAPREQRDKPLFVVATQTLEVGADLDFDVLVTELASLDALLQRFGRLNRMGTFAAARGAIVAAPAHLGAKEPDPIYGITMPATWAWLNEQARDGVFSMGLEALATALRALAPGRRREMTRLGPGAPILLPAHLDALAQTNPRPEPEPDIALFLHGVEAAAAEAQIVWRADLTEKNRNHWPEIAAFCPPHAIEAFPVRLGGLRRWLSGDQARDDGDADVEGAVDSGEDRNQPVQIPYVVWRNGKATSDAEVRPGDTVMLPASVDLPEAIAQTLASEPRDLGDMANIRLGRRATWRWHPDVIEEWPESMPKAAAVKIAGDQDTDAASAMLNRGELPIDRNRLRRVQFSVYPGSVGVRMEARFRQGESHADEPVTLKRHLEDVRRLASTHSGALPAALAAAVEAAALRHDWGKADPRFQAMLRGGDGLAGRLSPVLLAKSGRDRGAYPAPGSTLPKGFRHELLSFLMADKYLQADFPERDLALHLIASHHGYCRPFAPVTADEAAPGAALNGAGNGESISAQEIQQHPACRLDAGVPERFWFLTRRFGWWGLPYLESLLRLADWRASAQTATEVSDES